MRAAAVDYTSAECQKADRPQPSGIYTSANATGNHCRAVCADRHRARVIAFSDSLLEPLGHIPRTVCGQSVPVNLAPPAATQLKEAIDALVDATGLIGLKTVWISCWDGKRFNVLRINPRPSATLAPVRVCGSGPFGSYIANARGAVLRATLPDRASLLVSPAATAHAVVAHRIRQCRPG